MAIVTYFKDSKIQTKDLKEVIRECELPVELRELLFKFCSANLNFQGFANDLSQLATVTVVPVKHSD